MTPEEKKRMALKFISGPEEFIISQPEESSKSSTAPGKSSDYLDKEALKDYDYVMDRAFYDDTVAAEIESDKKFAEENPDEAEKV